ncbi:MAG: S41 family peptidase [Algoriphagus sp.]|uniref:S41 family peptidase n=1 Tax=Algoriphagus sp. TaxID=1872435 RepID=UPI0026282213|nr:S41 family peptidase [Algoriphagus sp.]MDG1276545.1 S41 family peptidase [Algoriphagus sp.]
MKNSLTLFLLISLSFKLSAQSNCDCKPELEFVYEQIQTTSSFKDQVKGERKRAFEKKYESLRSNMEGEISKLACYWSLNQLMALIQDKHAEVNEVLPDFKLEDLQNPEFEANYRATESFKNFPKTVKNIASLTESLKNKPLDDIEGIYTIGSNLRMGVYRTDMADSLVGVILSSDLGIWEAGQIFAYIKASSQPSHYDITYYGKNYKNLKFSKAQFFDNGMLFPGVLKEDLKKNYALIEKKEEEAYKLSYLNDDVQYVWLNSFNRNTMPAKRDALIEQISTELSAKNLIIDLRNNGGGADKISLPILKALKKKSANIYIITNFFTGSNAEMTTVRLKKQFVATQLGQRTYGAISYGSNYGKSYDSPSGLFNFYPTDMRQKQFIAYEEVGVRPEVNLGPESDWVEQTLEYIDSQSKRKK